MIRILILLITTFIIAGCGIKPSNVQAPDKKSDSTYPATYPNPHTDP